MVMLKTNVTIEGLGLEIADFLAAYIKIDKLIVFGSYGYGHPRQDSDFDIAVISKDFEQMSILKKIDLFSKASLAVDPRLELKGFSKREFLNPECGSMLELIVRKGKVIYPL